ncbi:hypothetical protein C8J57DRAFT_1526707 [Mycena rebaudengoi]|nr:hypothetical protein C8J57DRAFT_1526707 [Mycena rebaudengoi]
MVDRAYIPPHPFCPGSAKLAKYVQNMLIWAAPRRVDFALRVLSSCSGIRKLMLFGPHLTMLPALEKMKLWQLTVDLLVLRRSIQPVPSSAHSLIFASSIALQN